MMRNVVAPALAVAIIAMVAIPNLMFASVSDDDPSARPLSTAEQSERIGGDFAVCTSTSCLQQQNQGSTTPCPTYVFGLFSPCTNGQSCAFSCSNTISTGGICLSVAWDCEDRTLVNIDCGAGTGGTCTYVYTPAPVWPPGLPDTCVGTCAPADSFTCAKLKFCI